MPDFTMADLLAAQGGAPGPVYEGGPTGNLTLADVLGVFNRLGQRGAQFDVNTTQAVKDAAQAPGDVAAGRFNVTPEVPGQWSDVDEARRQLNESAANRRTFDLASIMIGAPGGTGGLGSGARDPNLWHGISQVKLPKPTSEMSASITPSPVTETRVTPAQLQGGQLLPAIGDRSAASGTLTGFNGFEFANPVELQGGHGYMPANTGRGVVWASKEGVVTGIKNKAEALAQGGDPVYFPYTAMGERAVDFSHMPSDALIEALPSAKISRAGRSAFNKAMRAEGDYPGLADWPGIGSQSLREYLANAPGYARAKFVKAMDTAQMQQAGFPSTAEARFAVTDPRLLDVPTGASGLSISRIAEGPAAESAHKTYEAALPGQYVGGFGTSVPKELMYPDIVKALEAYRERLPGYKPTIDYLMQRTPKGEPIAQTADQQWVDTVSGYLRSKGLLSGGNERAGALLAAAKAAEPQSQGIRAYHGSPYDFEKFDLSKIGTGEGAQSYGHGLYFAENPAVAAEYKKALSVKALEDFYTQLRETGSAPRPTPPTGKMYEVNINARPEQFVQYDKAIDQQSPELLQRLKSSGLLDEYTTAPYLAQEIGGNPARSAAMLNEAGIPGIKYLDQGSRWNSGAGDQVQGALDVWKKQLAENPNSRMAQQQVADLQAKVDAWKSGATSNYVVFNPDIVDIRKKWALLLAAMGGAGAAPTLGGVLQAQTQPQSIGQ